MNKLEASPRELKNLFINPPFQLKLMGYFIALFSITTLSLYSTTFLFFYKMKEKALHVGIPEDHIFFKFLHNQKSDLDGLFAIFALANFGLLLVAGILITHRVAGPVFKLKKNLASPLDESSEFKLRENDFFQELEPLIKQFKSQINGANLESDETKQNKNLK